MKLDITRDVQSSNVLELSDAELAVVSGGRMNDGGERHEHRDRDGYRRFHRWDYGWGQNDWQGSDCFGGYNSQQVFFVDQQSAPCEVISSYCGY